MRQQSSLLASFLTGITGLAAAVLLPGDASAERIRVTGLRDADFGLVSTFGSDQRRSQNVCVYVTGSRQTYSIVALGDGSGGGFSLANGAAVLPFNVEWTATPGASSGTLLNPSTPLVNQYSSASNQTCRSGPAASATLTVILRASDLAEARQGTYSGTLTLIVSAE